MSDEHEQAAAQIAEGAVQMLEAMLSVFAPHLNEEQSKQLSIGILMTQETLGGQVLGDAADQEKRDAYPVWGYKLTDTKTGQTGTVMTYKDPSRCEDMNAVMHAAMVVAFITSPAARALLAAYGYELEFFQSRDQKRIIAPS